MAMNQEFSQRLERIESVLNRALPEDLNGNWQDNSFGSLDECITKTHFSQLAEPCIRLVSLGGKRWRPLLCVLCAEMAEEILNRGEESVNTAYELTPLVEFAHTASLIHDDIEDNADRRRGKAAAHIKYGTDVAINAGSWLYFEAASVIKNTRLPAEQKCALYELFMTELRKLHLGQAMDILWHRNLDLFPTADEYKAMVKNKTGTLSRMAVKIGLTAMNAGADIIEKAGKIAEDIGTGFQILDDVTNLTTGNPGKKRGDDIVEGKKSLVVLMHINEHPQDRDIFEGLFARAQKEGIDSPAIERAISILSKGGSIEKARKLGSELVQKKSEELSVLFGKETKAGSLISELFASIHK